jgi:hypothetical protein
MEPNLFTKDEDNKEALLAIQDFKHILILSEAKLPITKSVAAWQVPVWCSQCTLDQTQFHYLHL